MNEKKLFSLQEFRKIVPISQAGLYKACSAGVVPTVRIGGRVFIPSWYVDKILNEPANYGNENFCGGDGLGEYGEGEGNDE